MKIANRFGLPLKALHGPFTLATHTGNEEKRFISSRKEILSGHKQSPCVIAKSRHGPPLWHPIQALWPCRARKASPPQITVE